MHLVSIGMPEDVGLLESRVSLTLVLKVHIFTQHGPYMQDTHLVACSPKVTASVPMLMGTQAGGTK